MKLTTLLATVAMTVALPSLKAADPIPYPLTTCVISGDKIGEMGKPFVFVYEGQEVKLCCKDCKKKFDADPAAAMKKIQEAAGKANPSGATHSMGNM